jgi:hypothetical protein
MFDIYCSNAESNIPTTYAYRRSFFLNCWHLNEHESAAMWDVYSRRDEGVAVVSSERRIGAALANAPEKVYGSQVFYGDYDDPRVVIDDRNRFTPALRKRASFLYEQEYRLVYWDDSVTHKQIKAVDGYVEWKGERFPPPPGRDFITVDRTIEEINAQDVEPGHLIACDVGALIQSVVLSPLAPDWMVDVVRRLAGSHGLACPVYRSAVLNHPRR